MTVDAPTGPRESLEQGLDRAVTAARAPLPGWRALPATARQEALPAIAEDLYAHAEELAPLAAGDTGNALRTQARPASRTPADLFLRGVATGKTHVGAPSRWSSTARWCEMAHHRRIDVNGVIHPGRVPDEAEESR
jgi:acyl-CoA reductase-like NAD-dependent aldehyde dehydrogenase